MTLNQNANTRFVLTFWLRSYVSLRSKHQRERRYADMDALIRRCGGWWAVRQNADVG